LCGRYFDGFKEIPSSVESRDKSKARTVWEQSAKLAGLSQEDAEYLAIKGLQNTTPLTNLDVGLKADATGPPA
jgi:hypothetical protein